jgi:phage-related minor tail protein
VIAIDRIPQLGTTIGNILIPPLDQIAQKLEPIIAGISAWATAHPKLTEGIIATVVALTGFLVLISVIGIAALALGAGFAVLASPVALFAGVIVALAVVVASNWNLITSLTTYFVENMEATWQIFWQALSTVTNVLTQAIATIVEFAIDLILAAIYVFTNTVTFVWNAFWGGLADNGSKIG